MDRLTSCVRFAGVSYILSHRFRVFTDTWLVDTYTTGSLVNGPAKRVQCLAGKQAPEITLSSSELFPYYPRLIYGGIG